MDLAELTSRVRTFATDRQWEQFHTPKNLAMALAGEVGELLAELQWLTPEQSAAVMADPELGPRVRAEIGDVTIYLVRLADVLGLDLVEAAADKLDDSARRYTVEAALGSATKIEATTITATTIEAATIEAAGTKATGITATGITGD